MNLVTRESKMERFLGFLTQLDHWDSEHSRKLKWAFEHCERPITPDIFDEIADIYNHMPRLSYSRCVSCGKEVEEAVEIPELTWGDACCFCEDCVRKMLDLFKKEEVNANQ